MDDDQISQYAALGEMVAVVRALEFVLYQVAECLGVYRPGFTSASDAVKSAKKQVRAGLPPWARDATKEEINVWLGEAEAAIRARHPHIHWIHGRRTSDGGSVRISPRIDPWSWGSQAPGVQEQDDAELSELTSRGREVLAVGSELLSRKLWVPWGDGEWGTPRLHQMPKDWCDWLKARTTPQIVEWNEHRKADPTLEDLGEVIVIREDPQT